MNTIKLLILLLLALPLNSFAQEYGEGLSHHQAGISVSTLSGYGASYSYIFNRDHRIKSTIFAFYQDHGSYSNWSASLGLEFQVTFESSSVTRFYGLVGGSYYKHGTTYDNTYYDYSNDYYYSSNYSSTDAAAGIGIGFELLAWNHIVFNLEGTVEYSSHRTTSYYSPYLTRYFGPGFGSGINYRF